jgi:hypothetical protein
MQTLGLHVKAQFILSQLYQNSIRLIVLHQLLRLSGMLFMRNDRMTIMNESGWWPILRHYFSLFLSFCNHSSLSYIGYISSDGRMTE